MVNVLEGGFVPRYTRLRVDSIATAYGQCITQMLQCNPYPNCSCVNNTTFDRTVNHIDIWLEMNTAAWSGTLNVGSVTGRNPDGTTAHFHELDSQASNSTGPVYSDLTYPGTYTFKFQASINSGVCSGMPTTTEVFSITVNVREADDAHNYSETSCNSNVAEPINVTNGNVYLDQTDYRLPGFGAGLEITRTYNSGSTRDALFGYAWSSMLDESIQAYGTKLLRLIWSDGRAIYVTRPTGSGSFTPDPQSGFRGQIVVNGDGSYTYTLKDGGVHQFSAAGKLFRSPMPTGIKLLSPITAAAKFRR